MRRIDAKSSTGTPPLRWAERDPAALPHGCHGGAWSLECPACPPFRLPRCGLLVGRSPLCDLVLDDPEASRRHARIALMDEQAWIVDLGSANGTLVDGNRATRVRLRDGAEILVGNTRLRLRGARGEDDPLPRLLWDPREAEAGSTRAERLRRLAGAQTCTWAEGAHPLLQWEGGATWEDLGPARRLLVERLVETA